MGLVNPVMIVGAGIAGVAAAQAITAAGLPVVVLDRGVKIGGRMASRRTDDRPVDTGASYFTASDPAFEAVVDHWQQRGLARPWTDTFGVFDDGELSLKSGPMRWGAAHGLRRLVEAMAAGLDVRQRDVAAVGPDLTVDGEPAAAVVLAMPDPQARRLLHPSYASEIDALGDPFEPVLALTARWLERFWDVDGVFVAKHPLISWIADDGRRRGDDAPVLVAHSSSEFAAEHLDGPDQTIPVLVRAVRDVLKIDVAPESTRIHRWTYARPTGRRQRPYFLSDANIGMCGDAWSEKPRVEAAYLSGRALGEALAQRLA